VRGTERALEDEFGEARSAMILAATDALVMSPELSHVE
jgi:hypothetical protein